MFLRTCALVIVTGACIEPTLPECTVIDTDNVVLVTSDPAGTHSDITDGSQVQLIPAPQGGHILLVGARVKASQDCQLVATAALRDPASQRVIGLEQRPLLLERRSDGWATPRADLDAMPNVAVCPSAAATMPIFGHEYQLEVSLATLAGAPITTVSARIVPTCHDSTYCEQDCGPL